MDGLRLVRIDQGQVGEIVFAQIAAAIDREQRRGRVRTGFDQSFQGQVFVEHRFQRRLQRELDQRNAGRATRVGAGLFGCKMRRMVRGEDIDARVGQRPRQRFAIRPRLDCGVALDFPAQPRVVGVAVAQEMHAGFGRDLFVRDRAGFEQRQFVGRRDVQHVQPRAVSARGFHRPFRRLEASFARADFRMQPHRDVLPVLGFRAIEIRVDDAAVLAMHHHRHGRLAEHAIQRVRVADAKIAGRLAQEHLHARHPARIERADGIEVVVAGSEVEGVIGE